MYPGNNIGMPLIVKDGYGQLCNADFTPVAVVLRNGIDTTVPAVVQRTGLGLYTVALQLPANWQDGDVVDARVQAIVQGYTDVRVVRVGVVATAVSSRASQPSVDALAADVADLQGLV